MRLSASWCGYRPDVGDHEHPVDPDRVAAARERGLALEEARSLDALLSLLADTVRTRVLVALIETGEMCVGDIALTLDISEDSASYALRVLRTAGLVERRAEGRMGYYRVRDGDVGSSLMKALVTLRSLAAQHPERITDDEA